MRQGRSVGTTVTSMKVEPIPHAISPGGASEIGVAQYQNPTPLDDGRGFSAPRPVATTNSNSGSQGKH